VSDYFSYEDLFVFGIGFDIAGAYLLAKGLLLSSRQILNLSSSFLDFNPPGVVSRAEDKATTYIGVGALLLGFLLQLLGYLLDLEFRSTLSPSRTRALLAFLLAAFAIDLVFLLYRLLKHPWRNHYLVDISCYDRSGKQPYPYGRSLELLGAQIGFPRLDDESPAAYAKRVWNVDQITDRDP
jgi:hypothetical protein